MAAKGDFDALLVIDAWFDDSQKVVGWFDANAIDNTPTGSANAPGAALSVAFSVSGGAATGTASASGASLTVTYSVNAGAATGGANATVAALTYSQSVTAGSATGGAAGTGAALAFGLSVSGGAATGDAAASGAALTVTYSLDAGLAAGGAGGVDGNASGADLTVIYGLTAGAADGGSVTQSLHGKRRGKRVIYPDELPAPVAAPVIEPLPSLEVARVALVEAKTALEAVQNARIKAAEREERQRVIDGLSAELNAAQARYDAAREAEARIVRRLRDEDELFLLAA